MVKQCITKGYWNLIEKILAKDNRKYCPWTEDIDFIPFVLQYPKQLGHLFVEDFLDCIKHKVMDNIYINIIKANNQHRLNAIQLIMAAKPVLNDKESRRWTVCLNLLSL